MAPACIAGGLWVGSRLADRWRPRLPRAVPRGAWGAATLAALLLLFNVRWSQSLHALESGVGEAVYAEASAWARAHLPAESAIVGMQVSGAFFHYTDFLVVRWDFVTEPTWQRLQAEAMIRRRPLYAVFFPYETDAWKAFDRIPGRWRRIGAIRHVTV